MAAKEKPQKQHEKLMIVVLVGLTLPAFGLPAAAFLGGAAGREKALEIDDEVISKDEYQTLTRRWLNPRRQLVGREGSYEAKDLHAHLVLLREAEAAGVTVADYEVEQFIQAACTNAAWSQQNPISMPFFPDKKGFYWTLTSQVFYQLLQQSGQTADRNTTTAPWDADTFDSLTKKAFPLVSRADLRKSIREDLIIMKLRAMVDGANYVSTYDAYEKLAKDREEIAIEYAIAKAGVYDTEVRATPPTDDELKAHYEKRAKAFEVGIKRTCEVLVAEVDDMLKLITIDDSDGRAHYDRTRDTWRTSKGAKTDADAKAVESGPVRNAAGDGEKKDDAKKDDAKTDDPKTDDPKKDEPKKDEPAKEEPKTDEPKKEEPKKDTAEGGGGADLFEPQVGGAPAGEPKQEPPVKPGEPATPGEEPAKPADADDVLPYTDVQIQVRNSLRKDRAVSAADSVLSALHRIRTDLEEDVVKHDGDPLEDIESLTVANRRLARDPERFVPLATSYRLTYRKVTTFRSEAELRANKEGAKDQEQPIADFVLKDGTSIARDVADLYSEIPGDAMGRVSRVLRTGTARAMVRFLAEEPPYKPAFEEVKTKVLEHYYAERAMTLAQEAADKCVEALKGGETMQNAANASKMDYGTTGWFMRGGRIPFLPSAEKGFADAPFFFLPKGKESATLVADPTRRQYMVGTVYDRRSPSPTEIPEKSWAEEIQSMQAERRGKQDLRFSDPDTALARHKIKDFTDVR